MKPIFKALLILGLFISFSNSIISQDCSNTNVEAIADLPTTCSAISMTMLHDQMDRDFLYIANKEGGLVISDISQVEEPMEVGNIPASDLNNLDVISLTQSGNYLYLALGNIFNTSQLSGMAIIDVSTPTMPMVLDVWGEEEQLFGGAGIVKVQGDYAYLGAMANGLIILDISNKSNIKMEGQVVPDINYPSANPDPEKYNARGVAVKDDRVYLCYDAGGLRIIDVSDKTKPVEIGRYANPELNGLPRAYNNIVLDGDLVYVAIDYCGMEVLNISDPSNITLTAWWNPWNCQSNPLNWFSSPGHTNEMVFNEDCKTILMSTGKSDLEAVNVSDPTQPVSCFSFGGGENNIGTWGISAYKNQVYLSYVCAIIPFSSNWTGVKILELSNSCVTDVEEFIPNPIKVYPTLVQNNLNIELDKEGIESLSVYDLMGKQVLFSTLDTNILKHQIDFSRYENGMYILKLEGRGMSFSKRVLKVRSF